MENEFAIILRNYRKTLGWTQDEMAQKWSYSYETISAWERGKRTPGSQEIPRLANSRGEETPTLVLKRKTKGGIFDFYVSVAKHILEHSKDIDDPTEDEKRENI